MANPKPVAGALGVTSWVDAGMRLLGVASHALSIKFCFWISRYDQADINALL